MKVDEGRNPKRVGSLFGDKPTSSFFDTLRYRVKNFSPEEFFLKYVRGGGREGVFQDEEGEHLGGDETQESNGCAIRVIPNGV
jgi:hypothetical protein